MDRWIAVASIRSGSLLDLSQQGLVSSVRPSRPIPSRPPVSLSQLQNDTLSIALCTARRLLTCYCRHLVNGSNVLGKLTLLVEASVCGVGAPPAAAGPLIAVGGCSGACHKCRHRRRQNEQTSSSLYGINGVDVDVNDVACSSRYQAGRPDNLQSDGFSHQSAQSGQPNGQVSTV
jgi:hypothetical protein